MTERERHLGAMGVYARQLADLMTLKDWQVVIDEGIADERMNAQIHVVEGQKFARIYLAWDFSTRTPDKQRLVLVHELLHCHFDLADRIAGHGLKKGRKNAVRIALEHGVDDVARALAPHMPLPAGNSVEESSGSPTP